MQNLSKIANEYRNTVWRPRHTSVPWHGWQAFRPEEWQLAQALKQRGLSFTESQQVFALICAAQSKRQRRIARPVDPLALPVSGKAYMCDGERFTTRAGAKSHAGKVARQTERLTYQNMLSGSYTPDVIPVLVRG